MVGMRQFLIFNGLSLSSSIFKETSKAKTKTFKLYHQEGKKKKKASSSAAL